MVFYKAFISEVITMGLVAAFLKTQYLPNKKRYHSIKFNIAFRM